MTAPPEGAGLVGIAGGDAALRVQQALETAYRYLAHRERTVAEVRARLAGDAATTATIDAVVDELREQGYLDDSGYARRFTEDRRTLDGWGAERIERRLRTLGVGPDDIAAALGDRGAGDELEAAVEVLRHRVRVPPADDRSRERALRMLARRGYELDLAYEAVRRFEREG